MFVFLFVLITLHVFAFMFGSGWSCSYARSSAMTLSEASDEATTFSLDPSRGALLGLLVQTPSLMERVQQGKAIGFIIIFGTLVGLLLVLERWMRLARIEGRIKRQLGDMDSVLGDNPVGRVLGAYYENMHLQDLETISRKMEAVIATPNQNFKPARVRPLLRRVSAAALLV